MGESKASPRRIEVAERRAEALRMRAAQRSYDEITEALGYKTRSACIQDIQRALDATVRGPANHLVRVEMERLEAALRTAFEVMDGEHVTVSNGRVVTDPRSGRPLRDDGPRLAAADTVRRLSESVRKLFGLDEPTKTSTHITGDGPADEAWQERIRVAHERRQHARALMETPSDDPAPNRPDSD